MLHEICIGGIVGVDGDCVASDLPLIPCRSSSTWPSGPRLSWVSLRTRHKARHQNSPGVGPPRECGLTTPFQIRAGRADTLNQLSPPSLHYVLKHGP
jgi:hypothetical protein